MTAHSRPAESPYSRWWSRLDDATRRFLVAHSHDELPIDVWRECLSSAVTEGLVERDGWVGDLPAHHLPDTAARFVDFIGGRQGRGGRQ